MVTILNNMDIPMQYIGKKKKAWLADAKEHSRNYELLYCHLAHTADE